MLKRPGQPSLTGTNVAVDPVTLLPTRSHLHDWASEAIERSRVGSNRSVIAFVDVGQLRDVNDSYGPDAGDLLLRSIGARLSSIDLPNTRVLRYEGAEFVLVFEQITHFEM